MSVYSRRTVVTGAASIPAGTYSAPMTRTAVKTGNYTANLWEIVPADTTGGTFAVTLPAASGGKGRVAIKWVAGTTAPTIALTGSDHINTSSGPTSGTVVLTNQGFVFESDGSGIWTVTADDLPLTALDSRYQAAAGAVFVVKSVTQSVLNSNTVVDDAELLAAIAANETWMYEWYLNCDGSTTSDAKFSISVPSGASGWVSAISQATTATTAFGAILNVNTTLGANFTAGMVGAGTTLPVIIRALVINSTTAGNTKLQWAQNGIDGSVPTRVLANSVMLGRRH
jgi:hypothetical protein